MNSIQRFNQWFQKPAAFVDSASTMLLSMPVKLVREDELLMIVGQDEEPILSCTSNRAETIEKAVLRRVRREAARLNARRERGFAPVFSDEA